MTTGRAATRQHEWQECRRQVTAYELGRYLPML
ncbi:hypothetical protein MPTA5024_10315 [Microbispora sp. ATCC PTA-5024]|nr:hypothetical protein MPTA5024_10315 [Microbispora sp. ATCC PTA-5024]